MNLFVTAKSPVKCAINLDDKRLVKAVLETAQLLSTALGVGYKPSFTAHPVTLWVCASKLHQVWTRAHLVALCEEYTFRFNKRHACQDLLSQFKIETSLPATFTDIVFQNSARNLALGLDYTHLPVPQSYKAYLLAKWKAAGAKGVRWTNREFPSWFKPKASE